MELKTGVVAIRGHWILNVVFYFDNDEPVCRTGRDK